MNNRRNRLPEPATQPMLPDDEAPLDAATLDALLQGMGTDMEKAPRWNGSRGIASA